MRRTKAFTLIELLVVMAITAVMMTLIVLPIFQSFNLTRNAQAFSDAQDKARILTERISREVGNAVAVRSPSGPNPAYINATDVTDVAGYGTQPQQVAGTTLIIRLPGNPASGSAGKFVETKLPNSKLDIIPPAQGRPGPVPGVFVNPNTGKIDPTLKRPIGDIRLPVAPGATIIRYFVGLNRAVTVPADGSSDQPQPLNYNEPYSGLIERRNGDRDNLYVLRRAEVQPYEYRSNKNGALNSLAWRPNLAFFRSDDATDTKIIDLDDPRFFIPDQGQLPGAVDATKNQRVLNWQKASVVQTEISRYDMIRPITAGATGAPTMTFVGGNTGAVPNVVSLIQFLPTRVASANAGGSAAARPGEAIDGFDRIGPETYLTEHGLLTNAIIRYYPNGYDPNTNSGMEVAVTDEGGSAQIRQGAPSTTGLDMVAPVPLDFDFFHSSTYEDLIASGTPYPFTKAALEADDVNVNPGYPMVRWTDNQRLLFTPFRLLTATGKIITSFPIEEVGENFPLPARYAINLPTVFIGDAYSPVAAYSTTQAVTSDPNYLTAPFSPLGSGSGAYDPNRAFNRAWNAYPALQGKLHRFIDLRMIMNPAGAFSPLYPNPESRKVQGFNLIPQISPDSSGNAVNSGALMNRVKIVPGSDEVFGPDQTVVGANYGGAVRYTRVANNPGPNQYKLVYADLPEPTNGNGLVDYSVLGIPQTLVDAFTGSTSNGTVYNGNDVISAMIQPQYKAGYLEFNSDPGTPIPAGPVPVTVRYRFQFNGPGDSFAVDYDTREVMQILLTIKNYPQSSVPNAQTVTLKSTATLRNTLR